LRGAAPVQVNSPVAGTGQPVIGDARQTSSETINARKISAASDHIDRGDAKSIDLPIDRSALNAVRRIGAARN